MTKYQAWVSAPHPDHGMTAPTWRKVGKPQPIREEARLEAEKEALRYFPNEHQIPRRLMFLSRIVIKEEKP